jgi:hypothetical protein
LAATVDTPSLTARPRPEIIAHDVEPAKQGCSCWFTTTVLKMFGVMFLVSLIVLVALCGVDEVVMG